MPKTSLSVCRSIFESAPLQVAHTHSIIVGVIYVNSALAGGKEGKLTFFRHIRSSYVHAKTELIKCGKMAWLGHCGDGRIRIVNY